ncbi:hypothetical protein TrVE_jg7041 [Triparma verrucosa]|uniref:ethanolamine-phosphate cytidylyltransferase n=1 Tax=Triparma verrucosa TaxID=1606542 RepID=A0A9W7C8M3_9STRA|nr:hypothetical protein TrVE_jg7041 [Triparma verrucosa]
MPSSSVPPLGPAPLLLNNKQISALYKTLKAIRDALKNLNVEWIVTGGSLLGAVRQEGMLFCDDDIDIAILSTESREMVRQSIQSELGRDYHFKADAWEGGDRVRPRFCGDVFVDVFCLREYEDEDALREVLGKKKNGDDQPKDYVDGIVGKIKECTSDGIGEHLPLFPCYHFATRKAIEMWPKEVYRNAELLPIRQDFRFGNVEDVGAPRCWRGLLERAFGRDCFEVYYASVSHQKTAAAVSGETTKQPSGPKLLPGGLWESSEKTPLKDEQYIPIQPLLRKERKETDHCKVKFFKWLEREEKIERCWLSLEGGKERVIYMDGVFDLFHVGHLEAIQQARRMGDRLILGVTGDDDAEGYKRRPFINEVDRCAILRALRDVDEIVCPCPLVVAEEFMREKGIHLVVHGFKDYEDAERQREFFEYPMEVGRFELIQYSKKASTSEILDRIIGGTGVEGDSGGDGGGEAKGKGGQNPEWFGASVASVTNSSASLPTPFTKGLEEVILKHVEKAMATSNAALARIEKETPAFQSVLERFCGGETSREGTFVFDTEKYDLVGTLLDCAGMERGYDLSKLHEVKGAKDQLYKGLIEKYEDFQELFDKFVMEVCIPQFEKQSGGEVRKIYYQSFPCVRVVEVGDFSIGVHSDVSYGHHPCTVNFYIPLTKIFGTNALYMESVRGLKDFHPIFGEGGGAAGEAEGGYYGVVKHFAGAICTHWTTENNTDATRVSLDVRLIDGNDFEEMEYNDNVYKKQGGFYHTAVKQGGGRWVRVEEELHKPDGRTGYPWTTVKKKT